MKCRIKAGGTIFRHHDVVVMKKPVVRGRAHIDICCYARYDESLDCLTTQDKVELSISESAVAMLLDYDIASLRLDLIEVGSPQVPLWQDASVVCNRRIKCSLKGTDWNFSS
jgi:hypothetical protein